MKPILKKLYGYADMEQMIRSAGAWFVGSFTMEILDNYDKLQNQDTKDNFIFCFHNKYFEDMEIHQLRNRINCIIRIIESNMVEDAMEYVLNSNDEKIGCDESKVNAQFLIDLIHSGQQKLILFD